ncbi:MAG TPA: hypothetical protein VEI03_20600 [Stellaceae bacterium]|nr:hypothetical protein [Stellaceae bacterium]
MPVQFTGSLDPGQYEVWTTYGWNREFLMEWSVRPRPGQIGEVALRALAVEATDDGTLTYWLTVWNVGQQSVDFEALYSAVTTAQNVIDDPSGAYTLGAGGTLGLQWDLGVAPTLLALVAIPQVTGAVFECSTPSVQLNADGTATYFFTVTNTGAATASFRLRAGLT